MFRVRPVEASDLEAIVELAFQARIGITNLPKNKKRLEAIMNQAIASFSGVLAPPLNPLFLFGVEEFPSSKLVGVAGIFGKTGTPHPLDYFRLGEWCPPSYFPEQPAFYPILERVRYLEGPSEVCSLYLSREVRKSGVGKLLSFSRFLFMKAFASKFTEDVFADLRGWILPDGTSPFWDALGSKFLPITFEELMRRRDEGRFEAAELMPFSPVYLNLLPDSIRALIGQVHPNSVPAYQMLRKQGFEDTGEVDIFDGGPRVKTRLAEIQAIKQAVRCEVLPAPLNTEAPWALISNDLLAFKAVLANVHASEGKCFLDEETRAALNVQTNDFVWVYTL